MSTETEPRAAGTHTALHLASSARRTGRTATQPTKTASGHPAGEEKLYPPAERSCGQLGDIGVEVLEAQRDCQGRFVFAQQCHGPQPIAFAETCSITNRFISQRSPSGPPLAQRQSRSAMRL